MKFRLLLIFFAFWAVVSCSSDNNECENCEVGNANWTGWPFDDSGENLQAYPECLNYENPIEIKYSNGGSPEIINPYEEVSVDKNGENVTVTLGVAEYNLLISGTAQNGSLKIYGKERMGLYLNAVNITNNSGPAINIQKGKRINVCLVSGTENYLADGASYATPPGDEKAKGTFFSEEKLYFTGTGSLEVKAKYNHAIVVDNDFEIDNGKIIISEAVGDGIHANDKIQVNGGVIKIASKGDALQSEKGSSVIISGGKILAQTTGIKSHGISSEGSITINENAKIQISVSGNGSKGIKSSNWMEILGGTTAILASGAQDKNDADTSTAAGIKVDANLNIEGGNLTIKSTGSKAKGINTSGDINMKNGNVDIEADDDGIKVHGTLKMSGGSISVKSRKSDNIDGKIQEPRGGTINGN